MTTELIVMQNDIYAELERVKDFVNTKGYNNSTAVNQIVSRYRKELKTLLKTLNDDINDGLEDYKDC